MYLNDIFDKIFVINLKKDIIKKEKILQQFNEHKIDFEFLDAVYGYDEPYLSEFNQNKILKSPGEYGYLQSWKKILEISIREKYKKILVFDDDVILLGNFEEKAKIFFDSISKNWKVINLGVSEFNRFSLLQICNNYYHPIINTSGSFAFGVDSSIFNELLESVIKFDAAFDTKPLENIYQKYYNECFVCYPNIVVANLLSGEINPSTKKKIIRRIKRHGWDCTFADFMK